MSRLLLLLLLFSAVSIKGQFTANSGTGSEPLGADNLCYQWAELALEATANDTRRFNPRPTITSRYLGLVFIAVFDAWSRYDDKAVPVYLQAVDRRPSNERHLSNKEIAISYAAYHALKEYFYTDSSMFASFLNSLGYDPDHISMDSSRPEGIGYLAARSVIEARKGDGANQYGEEPGSDGMPYFNYTGYEPVNSADISTDPMRWQPKYFADEDGGFFAPGCLTPFWDKVKPVALQSGDQFRPGPPPALGSAQLEEEVREVVERQSQLTDEEKALVEFMRDGPASVQQAGHWLKFAQDVSVRDQHTLDEDVKMYFLNQLVAMDAFIAAWDAKMYYDYARPYALVHELYRDSIVFGWAGEKEGWKEIPGEQWRPYSPETFLCPPFPSYVSGHSTISAACAEALRRWTGSDFFGVEVEWLPGSMTEPGYVSDPVKLVFPTFTAAGEMAGESRILGGYHIQSENVAGLELGRRVAAEGWKFYLKHTGELEN